MIQLKTLPLNIATKAGEIVNLKKKVNRVILRLHESLGVLVEDNIINDRKFIVSLDQAPIPFTGIKENEDKIKKVAKFSTKSS